MGVNKINYEQEFIKRGVFPLEEINSHRQKVSCIDKEGYKYVLSYHNNISDKRIKSFDKWDKTNPYKSYNMRLFASKINRDIVIVSNDEDLMNATKCKIKFKCPLCGKVYEKKWCHWLEQADDRKNCPKCNFKQSQYEMLTEQWLKENNIQFISEYRYDDCRDKKPLPFDFKIEWKGRTILIEVDGSQHYYLSFGETEDKLKDRKTKDLIKTNFCKNKGYLLIRLPWWWFNSNKYKEELYKTFFG